MQVDLQLLAIDAGSGCGALCLVTVHDQQQGFPCCQRAAVTLILANRDQIPALEGAAACGETIHISVYMQNAAAMSTVS